MSAVLETVAPTDEVSRAVIALAEARRALVAMDVRIAVFVGEQDDADMAAQQHRVATITAVSNGQPLPKAPKVKQSDAAVALPILRKQRAALVEQVTACEGKYRGACFKAGEAQLAQDIDNYAATAAAFVEARERVLGTRSLLAQASEHVPNLPHTLTMEFAIPAIGNMPRIGPNHWAYFHGSHDAQQGGATRATERARARLEADIRVKLPW